MPAMDEVQEYKCRERRTRRNGGLVSSLQDAFHDTRFCTLHVQNDVVYEIVLICLKPSKKKSRWYSSVIPLPVQRWKPFSPAPVSRPSSCTVSIIGCGTKNSCSWRGSAHISRVSSPALKFIPALPSAAVSSSITAWG